MNNDMSLLDRISVASPCNASWSEMEGDDRRRFCRECKLHVYNLSAMRHEEAETLIRETEGRRCVRFYRRHDGTVLTDDCPVGLRAARRRLRKTAGLIAAAFALLFGSIGALGGLSRRPWYNRLREREPFTRVAAWLSPEPAAALAGEMVLPPTVGDVVITDPADGES